MRPGTEPAGELVAALRALRERDRKTAHEHAIRAGEQGWVLGTELARHLEDGARPEVYDQPAAFRAFVRGGGNVPLYQNLSRTLARHYELSCPGGSLLDIGCGDGLALAPAVELASPPPARLDLVEPSAELLRAAGERLAGFAGELGTHPVDAQAFTGYLGPGDHWDLAQATFSLQSVPPADRPEVLRGLREHTGGLLIAEFDVPDLAEGGPEHLHSLATRYERGIAEYAGQAGLVAKGFMLPMLLGLLEPGRPRTNWEQPVQAWRELLADAGYRETTVTPIHDYWWSPAVLLHAR
ncbi:class I SAM-dependent methyltransferase [Amycolatopsis aidingensis]|uniref:class I SAM-dependent methyltransferase n=1 Tax=Amycolatopsis aidingensis TaxID=2842453 RepID=UPI001C0BDA7A|nr:class I SAM-dependent methyltransferase [Amycolatopsis aidingensis]